MEEFTFEQFSELCADSDVELDQTITQAALNGKSSKEFSLEPTAMYAAVAQAGRLLRKTPGKPIATGVLDFSEPTGNIAAHTLGDMVNASIEPVASEDPITSFCCDGVRAIDTCTLAEQGFVRTVNDLLCQRSPEYRYDQHPCVVTLEQEPIFLQKGVGANSTLSLQEVVVNGVPYPPGSIFRIDFPEEYDEGTHSYIPCHSLPPAKSHPFAVTPIETVSKIGFARLSMFAAPPEQRQAFFKASSNLCYKPIGEKPMGESTLTDITAIVKQATVSRIEAEAS